MFPFTQSLATEILIRELDQQAQGVKDVINKALESAGDYIAGQQSKIETILPILLEKALSGEELALPWETPKVDIKLGFFRVNCMNRSKIPGVQAEARAEGNVFWGLAWRFKGGFTG